MRQAGAVAGVRFGIEEVTEESSIHSLPVSGGKVGSAKVESGKVGNGAKVGSAKVESGKVENGGKVEKGKMESGKVENGKMEGKEVAENDTISGIPEGTDLFGFDSRTPMETRTENPSTPSPIPQIGMISDLVFFAAPLDR